MNHTWRDWFVFTRKERTGILVLVVLILIATCLPWSFTVIFSTPDPARIAQLEKEIANARLLYDSSKNSAERYMPYDDKPVAERTFPSLFVFDPNKLPVEGWKKLGVREKTALTIQKFLAHGGQFRQPADLGKIFGLSKKDVARLMPYVRIQPGAPEKPVVRYKEEAYPKYKKPAPVIMEINSADTSALIALPGIGSKLARRIISFRDKLGGFYSAEQVKETYGLSDSTFQSIRPYLTCEGGSIQKININTADMALLAQHPYIGRNLANTIIRFRDQHGDYKQLEDLQQIVLITPEIFQKIVHYLAVK